MTATYEKEYDNVLDELQERGYYDNATAPEALKERLGAGPQKFYIGFDATADSLTIGHFIQIMVMMRMQAYGHTPIALLGGGTTLIGDPSGRSDMRQMMTEERIQQNADNFYRQLSHFIDFSQGRALIRNNADWLRNMNFMDFMREIGIHFNVGEMIKNDAYHNRLKAGGLTFFEFSYMLLQSYDFLQLYREEGCCLQLGGSDQWANIISGVNLIKKVEGKDAYGMTFKLLTTASGQKMGKSMKGAVWLDEKKTSPYDLFQYMRNCDDRDVTKFLLQLTFLPSARCRELGSCTDERINESKEVLAYEVTRLVHGEKAAQEALETSRSLFVHGQDQENMPSREISLEGDSIGLLTLLTEAGLTSSNGQARRLVQQGGISIDDERVDDPSLLLDRERLEKGITVKKGKKTYLRIKAR